MVHVAQHVRHARPTAALAIAIAVTTAVLTGCGSSGSSDEAGSGQTSASSSALAQAPAELEAAATEQAAAIIGSSEADARAAVEAAGLIWRVGTRDGQPQPVTMDYRPDRITVTIDGGVVTEATVG